MGRASRKKRERREGGDCFDRAYHDLWELDVAIRPFARLCHGTVTGTGGAVVGKRFGHAWVEIAGGLVVDNSNGDSVTMLRERYYALGQVTNVRRYDWQEAMLWALRSRHFGPWE